MNEFVVEASLSECMVYLFEVLECGGDTCNPLWLYYHDLMMEIFAVDSIKKDFYLLHKKSSPPFAFRGDAANVAALFLSIETKIPAVKIMKGELSSDEYLSISGAAGRLTNSKIKICLICTEETKSKNGFGVGAASDGFISAIKSDG